MFQSVGFLLILTILCLTMSGCSRKQTVNVTNPTAVSYAININTATAEELQRIPHIGEKLAEKIIVYREANGPFRRVEHLMLIQGISDTRFRKIRNLVRVE